MKSALMTAFLVTTAAIWPSASAPIYGQSTGLNGDEISSISFETVPAGVDLVSETIGLQGNVDVAGDLSLAADLRFSDGTIQSTAADPALTTTVIVSPVAFDPLASGQVLRDALAAILDAGPAKTYLIKLEPGIYDVRSAVEGNSLIMKPWVSIEGSGETVTEIRSGGSETIFEGTVITADSSELRQLTVRNIGKDLVAIAIFAASNSSSLDHVTAIASGGTDLNYGVRIAGLADDVRLFDVVAEASGGSVAYGVTVKNITTATLERVSARAAGAGEKIAFFVLNELGPPDMTVIFDGVVGEAEGETSSCGLRLEGEGVLMSLRRSVLSASGAMFNAGVDVRASVLSSLVIAETTITATGPASYGIRNAAPDMRLDHSRVEGETHSLFNASASALRVGATRLEGGPASGIFKCVGAYDGSYDALAADCITVTP